MFIEYIRFLDIGANGVEGNYYQTLLKLLIVFGIGLGLIYISYKILGKFGAISVLILEITILAIANDMLPIKLI